MTARRDDSVTEEWGYRLDDDPYIVRMASEKHARQIAEQDPNVTIVRRFISEWEEVS